MSHTTYPETVAEILDDAMKFRCATLQAMQQFADAKPWSGTVEERQQKFIRRNRALTFAYGVTEPDLVFEVLDGGTSGRSRYEAAQHRIVLAGRLSVITYLHEFAHSMGHSERMACRWSVNLFRLAFPQKFSGLIQVGHLLINPRSIRRGTPPRKETGT
jgi:hypothetical protein